MNREIKFRAWSEEEKTMITLADAMNCEFVTVQDKNTLRSEFDSVKLMQYTGLKDKYGKEIYEGDIIKGNLIRHSPLATRGEIVWDEYWASFANKNDAGNTLLQEINQLEIIGNVYENKDLL